MIDLKAVNKIYLANGYTDLRAGIDGYISNGSNLLKVNKVVPGKMAGILN